MFFYFHTRTEYLGFPTNVGVRAERDGRKRRLKGSTERTMLSFFKAFSGRFSKYLIRKTLLHAQKVNSQPKAESMIHTGENIERFVKRLTTAQQKMWCADCTVWTKWVYNLRTLYHLCKQLFSLFRIFRTVIECMNHTFCLWLLRQTFCVWSYCETNIKKI